MRWLVLCAVAGLVASAGAMAARERPVRGLGDDRIVLVADRPGEDIEVLDSRCRQLLRLRQVSGRIGHQGLQVSRLGFVAFARLHLRAPKRTAIVVRRLHGPGRERIVGRIQDPNAQLLISPGGGVLAFSSPRGIALRDLRTGTMRRLVLPAGRHYAPSFLRRGLFLPSAFSADGSRLASVSSSGIALTDVRSGRSRRLPLPPGLYYSLAFSPDGRRLAAVRQTSKGDPDATGLRAELVLVDLAAGRWRTLLRAGNPFAYQPAAAFTAGGQALVLVTERAQVATLPFTGGTPRPLTQPTGRLSLSDLVVLPHGAGYVYSRAFPDRVTDVFRVDLARRVTRLTVTAPPPLGATPMLARPLAVAPDGRRLLVAWNGRAAVIPAKGGRPTGLCPLGGRSLEAASWPAR